MISLKQAFDPEYPQLTAIVGSGGKTSLMFGLASEALKNGRKVITTTTTKIFHPRPDQSSIVLLNSDRDQLRHQTFETIEQHAHLTIALSKNHQNKLIGIEPELADDLFSAGICDLIVVEADGARGLPLKAPGQSEPVIPSKTGLVTAVVGLGGLGKPLTDEHVFRPEVFGRMARLAPGGIIEPKHVARVLTHPQGHFKGAPKQARRAVLLNQADLIDEETARQTAQVINDVGGTIPLKVIWGSLQNPDRGFHVRPD